MDDVKKVSLRRFYKKSKTLRSAGGIFAADMVEPNRKYPEAEELRKAVYADLDRGVLACVDATIAWNEQKAPQCIPMHMHCGIG